MSREALATVKRGHEAFNRGVVSVVLDLATPEVEWGATGAFPGVEGRYHGREAIQEWADVIRAEWEEFGVSLEQVLHEGDDLVVVVERLRGRGRGSGAQVEMSVFSAYWFDERGKITRRSAFTERDAALEAAGLSE
jgi:ketosteroid isomerase-like protein